MVEGFEWLGSGITNANAEKYLKKFWYSAEVDTATPLSTSRGSLIGAYMDLTSHTLLTRKLQHPTTGDTTCIVGFYWKTPNAWFGGADFLRIYCGGTDQCFFEMNGSATGTMNFRRGGTTLGTSSYALATNNEYYIEIKVVIADGTGGSMEMKIADITAAADDDAETVSEWTISGVDTKDSSVTGETAWDQIQFFMAPSTSGHGIIDDIYIANGAGSDNMDFQGNLYVETLEPSGAGNSTQLTPSTGNNWENVDDSTNPDDDTTYNTADADAETDLYTMTNPVETASPSCVTVQALVRCTDADRRTIRLPFRNNGTTSEGDDIAILADTYQGRTRMLERDASGAVWTNVLVNGLESGIKRQANS